jgi:hypothetical protein
MSSCCQVIKSIEDNVESCEPVDAELRVRDIRMIGFQLCAGLEPMRNFLRNLDVTNQLSDLSLSLSLIVVVGIARHPRPGVLQGRVEISGHEADAPGPLTS